MTRAGWAAVAGAALVGLVWLPTLGHRLLFVDDLAFTVAAVERLHAGALFAPRAYYRPVVELLLCGLWAGFGTAAPAYRAVLLALHGLSGGLMFGLGRVIGLSRSAAACAALLFLLAPIHRETVMWTTGIIHVTGGVASFGCLLLVAQGWLWGRRAVVVAFLFVIGLLAYPSVLLLPVLVHAAWKLWHRDRPWPMGLVAATTVAVIGWGVMEYLLPLLSSGGRYPHLQDVSRQPLASVANTARNVLVGLTYAWSPGSVAEVLPAGVAPVVKALLVAASGAAAWRAWWSGPGGRWLILAAFCSLFPFAIRNIVDARMLYVTAAMMSLVLASAVAGLSGQAVRAAAAGLVAMVLVNAGVLLRWSRVYREAGVQTTYILDAVRSRAPDHRPGGLVVLRGFPRWVGRSPWVAPLLVYAPDNVLRLILADPRAELRLLDSVEAVPPAAVRSVILIEPR